MTFIETVQRAGDLLRQQGRISLRALKREFGLDDEALEDLVEELVDVQQVAAREGKVLFWVGAASAEVARTASVSAPEPDEVRQTPEAERRQLTVLFCDLVDSTRLAAGMDPEDWRELVRGYQEAAAGAIERFDGHVAQYLGDGLLVYFGWPRAHEDDAERAVRAGLGIVAAVDELRAEHGTELAVRIGIHTGLVVVGEMGGGASRETLAMGDTPNVAARLQAIAAAGSVAMSAATLRLVAGLFVVEDLGAQELKGMPAPVVAYRVVQLSGVRNRLAAGAGHGLTPFVGREDERRLLRARFEQARDGEGQVVLLVGEAGIGKSRLARMLRDDLAEVPHTWIESGGAPYFAATPFHPIVEMLKEFLGAASEDTPAARVARLEQALGAAGMRLGEALPLLAPLVDLPVPAGYPTQLAAPEAARRQLLAALAAWVFGAARLQPMVILLEDLHWVDASTLELHQLLVDQGATAPLLLLYTARREFRAPWPLRSHHSRLMLSRLPERDTRRLVTGVAARMALPAEVIDAVVARTDGVPLFAEELTKAAIEAGARAVEQIPLTLADSLMARLDRLGEAKEVAQVGAVCGREFDYVLLRAVRSRPDPELEWALGKLVDAELLYVRGLPPEATYTFKHALVQEAAYQAMLKSRRRALHGRVAQVLSESLPEIAEAQPELVAHHLTEAGEAEAAVDAWRRAGERALQRGAVREAEASVRRGLAVLAALPEDIARHEREFHLQLALGQALMITKGYAAGEVADAFGRARTVGERIGDPSKMFLLFLGLWASTLNREGAAAARPLADQILAIAERTGLAPVQVRAHFAQAATRYYAGDFEEASEHADRALALYHEPSAWVVPIDPRVATTSYAALAAWALGRADRARQLVREGVAWASRSQRPAELAWAEDFAAMVGTLLRDPPAVEASARRTLEACSMEPNPLVEAQATMALGWAVAAQGGRSEGIAALRAGFARWLATGTRLARGLYSGWLADALASAGEVDEALAMLAEVESPACEEMRADTLRCRAELLARQGAPPDEVEGTFRASLDVARRQGAKAFELRTATRYAAWLRDHGRGPAGRALLAPVYAQFTEGFDTQDFRDAKALLEELA